jgi:hypothetical protein
VHFNKAIEGQPFEIKVSIALSISLTDAIPVDKMVGVLVFPISARKPLKVNSNEDDRL